MPAKKPFWEEKSLSQMSHKEWESLCDRCGKCCLLKLENEDDPESIYYTNIVCELYEKKEGDCQDYQHRQQRVPSCITLSQDNLSAIAWLPLSCSYRSVFDGRGLPEWHHLISGDKNTIHETGNSVIGKVIFENEVDDEEIEEHIVEWPLT